MTDTLHALTVALDHSSFGLDCAVDEVADTLTAEQEAGYVARLTEAVALVDAVADELADLAIGLRRQRLDDAAAKPRAPRKPGFAGNIETWEE